MRRLHGADDAECRKPRHIGLLDRLDMLDAMAAVARAVQLPCMFVSVDHLAHGTAADGVNGHLEAETVGLGGNGVELFGGEERIAVFLRPVAIAANHHGGAGFDHAIGEHLDEVAAQTVGVVALTPDGSLFRQHAQRHEILHVVGHADADRQALGLFDLVEKFELVEAPVHVLKRGDAEPGAIGEALLEQGDVAGALRGVDGVRVAAGRNPEALAPAIGAEFQHRTHCFAFAQLAGGKTIGAHDDFVADAQGLAFENTGGLQGCGVRPAGVMVGRNEEKRTVRRDSVQLVAVGSCIAENEIVGAVADEQGQVRIFSGVSGYRLAQRSLAADADQRQLREAERASEDMHVGFVEARHDRSAGGIDDARGGAGQLQDIGARADLDDAVSGNGNGFGARQRLIHRDDIALLDDDIGKLAHGVLPFWQTNFLARRRNRRASCWRW